MNTPIDYLRTGLSDRYAIEREIGSGGMATVYLGRDRTLRRKVAIKVLDTSVSNLIGRKRFVREVEVSSSLTHPHIVPIYASGEVSGFLYYVMPFIEGETVRHRMMRAGNLSVADALLIAEECASALALAHEHGVVHRDVKPENILLAHGHAVVSDFGVARAVSEAGGEALTRSGFAMGTPRYMSPEQARGEVVDHRADIYSLGAVLLEMVLGIVPMTGTGLENAQRRQMVRLPSPVQAIIERSLAPQPDRRFADAREFGAALKAARFAGESGSVPRQIGVPRGWGRGVVSLVVAVFAIGGIAYGLMAGGNGWSGDPERLVILPFENSGTVGDSSFAVGITDEILNQLVGVEGVEVVWKGGPNPEPDPRNAEDYALAGSVHWEPRRTGPPNVRVTASLIRISDSATVWTDRFDARVGDAFTVQSRVAKAVIHGLTPRLVR